MSDEVVLKTMQDHNCKFDKVVLKTMQGHNVGQAVQVAVAPKEASSRSR